MTNLTVMYSIAVLTYYICLLVRPVSCSLNSIVIDNRLLSNHFFFLPFSFSNPTPYRMNIPYLYRSNLVSWPLEPLRQHIGKSLLERSFALPCQTFPGRRGRPDLWEPSFCLFSLPRGHLFILMLITRLFLRKKHPPSKKDPSLHFRKPSSLEDEIDDSCKMERSKRHFKHSMVELTWGRAHERSR